MFKKYRVTSVFKNLVFKTSCESIEIHHWSIPHCGQPQQFNIQHSKVKIALRASVCKKIFVLSALFVFKKIHGDICVQKSRVPHVSAPPRTKIREIGEIRVQDKNIRVIRVITSLRSVGLRRISCSKEYIKGYALN